MRQGGTSGRLPWPCGNTRLTLLCLIRYLSMNAIVTCKNARIWCIETWKCAHLSQYFLPVIDGNYLCDPWVRSSSFSINKVMVQMMTCCCHGLWNSAWERHVHELEFEHVYCLHGPTAVCSALDCASFFASLFLVCSYSIRHMLYFCWCISYTIGLPARFFIYTYWHRYRWFYYKRPTHCKHAFLTLRSFDCIMTIHEFCKVVMTQKYMQVEVSLSYYSLHSLPHSESVQHTGRHMLIFQVTLRGSGITHLYPMPWFLWFFQVLCSLCFFSLFAVYLLWYKQ